MRALGESRTPTPLRAPVSETGVTTVPPRTRASQRTDSNRLLRVTKPVPYLVSYVGVRAGGESRTRAAGSPGFEPERAASEATMLPVTSAPICQASDAHDGVVAANHGTIPTSAGVRSPCAGWSG